jgi:hypothetical protein
MFDSIWTDGETALQTPSWITAVITPRDLADLYENEDRNSLMWSASVPSMAGEVMKAQDNDVLHYLIDRRGVLPEPPKDSTWDEPASFYLVQATKQWVREAYHVA